MADKHTGRYNIHRMMPAHAGGSASLCLQMGHAQKIAQETMTRYGRYLAVFDVWTRSPWSWAGVLWKLIFGLLVSDPISPSTKHINRIAARLWVGIVLFSLFAGINQAQAAITLVKNIGATAVKVAHTQLQVTVPAAGVAAGNTVIIAIALDYQSSNTPPIPSCSDSKGNTYTLDVEHNAGNAYQGAICSAPVTTALVSGDTITVTHASLNASAMSANEFSGLLTSGALDKTAKSNGSSTAPDSTATATTTQADELLFGTVSSENPPTTTFTAGAGFTALTGDGTIGSAAASNITVYPEYRIVTSTGTYSATGTLSAASNWIAAIATYKAAVDLCPGNVVTTTADTGSGSLRECINKANLFPGTTISFNIPGPGNQSAGADSWWRITPLTWLPGFIASNTIIDGTTQPGNTNSLGPEIEINGATVGGVGLDGFGVSSPASNVTITGFIINQWSGAGISLWTGTGTVTGNYLGTNYAGTAALANTGYGIYVNSNGNIIGGTTAAARNVIAGNGGPGIRIVGNSNTVQGNYIGVNATAGGTLANASDGIQITATATGNTLGGTAAGAGNVISGNTGIGISNTSTGSNSVQGNYIGTNASSASLPNGGDGLYTSAGTINLGNVSEAQSNIIGPNTGIGISLAGGTVNLAGTVSVNDDVTLSTGTLAMGSATLNVSGNWTRTSATVTPGTSTFVMNGVNKSLTGNTTFNNFTKSVATADTLTFASAATQTVNGLLTLNGASGQLLSLRASTPGNATNLTLAGGGTQAISYVDVKDNNAGGGQTLVAPNSSDSLNNTNWDFGLTSAPLTKQVWDIAGNCLASSNTGGGADSCNGNASSATVPSGTAVKFLIYIRNTSAVAMSNVRFQDVLDISGSGFTYSAGTMKYSNSQTDAATITSIYTATNGGTTQTDALGAPDDFASYVTGTLTVGAVAAQANQSVSIPGKRTFAILFQAVKN